LRFAALQPDCQYWRYASCDYIYAIAILAIFNILAKLRFTSEEKCAIQCGEKRSALFIILFCEAYMAIAMVGISTKKQSSVHRHKHSLWEILLNTDGSGYTFAGDIDYPFGPGTIICLPPGVFHSKASKEGYNDIYFLLTAFPLDNAGDKNGIILCQDDTAKTFESLISIAHRVYSKKEINYQLILNSLCETMLLFIQGRNYHSGHFRDDEDFEVELLKNKIVNSFTDPDFAIGKLLTESGFSKDYMRRRFEQATGCTPLKYLTNLRISFAQKLLKENEQYHYSIGEISAMSGYYDSRYFSRLFRQKTGMSPSDYINTL
jgi:AraC-like DNA-binding protein